MAVVGIVILAHNEASTIGRLLHALDGLEADAEVAVICNGCTDATAEVARRVAPWVRVDELDEASKPAALRAGDRIVGTFPRLYLDADVVLTAASIRRLVAELSSSPWAAVAPTPQYDIQGASRLVRSHYRVWTALQESSNAIAGTGAMMVSADGRARFLEWPDVIADDYFLDGLFGAREKSRLADVEVVVKLPRRFGGCVSRRARVHQGNRDVVAAGLRPPHGEHSHPARLLQLIREQPALVVDVPAHLIVTFSTRALSWWRRRRGRAAQFHRDATSR